MSGLLAHVHATHLVTLLIAQLLCYELCYGRSGLSETGTRHEAVAKRLVAERRWRLAMHSQSHPSTIMRDVLACLQHNQVSWKKQAPYNLKCRKAIGRLGALGHAPSTCFVSQKHSMRFSPSSLACSRLCECLHGCLHALQAVDKAEMQELACYLTCPNLPLHACSHTGIYTHTL